MPGLLAATYANLGTAYRKLGDDEKAQENYDHSLRLNPNQSNAYLGLGQLLERQNRLDEAIETTRERSSSAQLIEDFCFSGHALSRSAGRRAEALAAYQPALKISPDMAEAQHAVDALAAKPN